MLFFYIHLKIFLSILLQQKRFLSDSGIIMDITSNWSSYNYFLYRISYFLGSRLLTTLLIRSPSERCDWPVMKHKQWLIFKKKPSFKTKHFQGYPQRRKGTIPKSEPKMGHSVCYSNIFTHQIQPDRSKIQLFYCSQILSQGQKYLCPYYELCFKLRNLNRKN